MKKSKLPATDSIDELARFWDTHDLTDFEDELEEVREPVFVRRKVIKVQLETPAAQAVKELAQAKGVTPGELVREWVLQQLDLRNGRRAKKKKAGSSRETSK
jgi:hypothetical protein